MHGDRLVTSQCHTGRPDFHTTWHRETDMRKFESGSKLTALEAANDACADPGLTWQQAPGNDLPANTPWGTTLQTMDEHGEASSPDSPERA
jgi:hypothetical protein